MENLNNVVVINRNSSKSLTLEDLGSAEMFSNWKSACEALRLAISAYAVADRSGKDDTESELSACFAAYRKTLMFFNYVNTDVKLKPEAQDISAIRDVTGKYAKSKDGTTGKEFMPIGTLAFRKSIEDFISDRITKRLAKTAEEIEADKTVRREAKKAEKKAAAAAEAAAKVTTTTTVDTTTDTAAAAEETEKVA